MKFEFDDDAIKKLIAETIKTELRNIFNEQKHSSQPESEEFLSRQAAADFLHCSLVTLYHFEKKGKLIPLRLGRKILYPKSKLIAAMSGAENNRSP
jgi:hypothetical protein